MSNLRVDNELQRVLLQEYAHLRCKNPAFSIRAFSRRLGVGVTTLSEVLNGKRQVSMKMAERLTAHIDIDEVSRQKILNAHYSKKRSLLNVTLPKQINRRPVQEVEADQYKLIARWEHFAILSLLETVGAQSDSKWLAKRLGVSQKKAEQALELLVRLKMLQITSDNQYKLTNHYFASSDNTGDAALTLSHLENLDLARESLQREKSEDRDFLSVTMAIDPKKIPIAKNKIRNFLVELCKTLEAKPQTEVYKFNCQLFPLTKIKEQKK